MNLDLKGWGRRLVQRVFLALMFSALIFGEHKLFYLLHGSLKDFVEIKHFINLSFAYFFFTFIANSKARFAAYLSVPLFTFIQRMHQVYFGTQVNAIEIWHLFIQFGEVSESFLGDVGIFVLPVCLFLVSLGACLILFHFDTGLARIRFLGYILILLLLIEPYKTITSGNDFGKQPSVTIVESYNLYGSISYFVAHILPQKLGKTDATAHMPTSSPQRLEASPQRTVILVIGESVRYHHMSLFGYARQTTPFFESQVGTDGFYFRKTVASALSTDVAIPYLINAVTGPDQLANILSGTWCLFRMAKANGMKTFFLSTQTADSMEHIINYLCPNQIDVMKTMDAIENVGELAEGDDHSLIPQLDMVDFSRSNFIVLHQRGSHSPYAKRFPPRFGKISESAGIKGGRADGYDNSLLYGDHFFEALFGYLKNKPGNPIYVIFTSDHGQALGEQGLGGHGHFHESVYGVPFVFKAFRGESPLMAYVADFPEIIRHYDITLLMARLSGFDIQESAGLPGKYYISGLDIDFENGHWVSINQDRITELGSTRP